MQEQPNHITEPEEEGIDFIALFKQLWNGRKTIIICTCCFMALGLLAALTMKRTWSVSTTIVPQLSSKSSSSLSSLASLAGLDLGSTSSGGELSPLIYPQIVGSVPFRLELIHTPLHYEEVDTPVSMYTYSQDYAKESVLSVVKKYTIGLPSVILGALRKEKEPIVVPGDGPAGEKPLVVEKEEEGLIKALSENISLEVDKKEGYLTLSVKGAEPLMTAELAMKALHLLQKEVTRLRTEKTQSELDYIQARYDEVKAEAEAYQTSLAVETDRSQDFTQSRSRIERDRLQSKYTLANSIYADMAKQLEVAKMQVKKDTPVFTVIQPVTVPSKPSNSRAKTLIVWTFLGFILGCGIVLGKGYLPKLKEKLADEQSVS